MPGTPALTVCWIQAWLGGAKSRASFKSSIRIMVTRPFACFPRCQLNAFFELVRLCCSVLSIKYWRMHRVLIRPGTMLLSRRLLIGGERWEQNNSMEKLPDKIWFSCEFIPLMRRIKNDPPGCRLYLANRSRRSINSEYAARDVYYKLSFRELSLCE